MLEQQATGRMGARLAEKVESPYISGSISGLAVDNVVACIVVLWNLWMLDFNESYFTLHLFIAPKIADVIILYVHKVLKTFNHHLNHT